MSQIRGRSNFDDLDKAKLGWFHLRATIVAGVGFFADAYDIFIIGLALPMIYKVYYPNANYSKDNPWIDALLKASTSYGNLIGQLGFGYLGDKLGRKRMYGVELIIMIVSTIGCTFAATMQRGFDILTVLGIWRFFLGIGIGGDYPASAIITSEFANTTHRGMLISAVFAMQGVGILIGGIVTLATVAAFKDALIEDYHMLDYVWRIMIGLGIVPAVLAVYFRLTIPETPRYTAEVIGDEAQAQADMKRVLELNETKQVTTNWEGQTHTTTTLTEAPQPTIAAPKITFWQHFGKWEHGKVLFATAYCWFALDIAWYGLSLNNGTVLTLINYGGANAKNQFDANYQKAIGNLIIACLGTVPGYWVTVALVEKMGRKPIQLIGFGVITVILIVLAATWESIKTNTAGFLVLFTIAQFFFNFGPNTTTFVYPAEVFPTQFRSTAHGISAAAGKFGAIIGVQLVGPYFQGDSTVKIVLGVFAAVMASGFAVTWMLPETKGKTLEELSGEDRMMQEHQEVSALEK
ncbi:hypothetical protein HK104_005994 [Borealophlyctis nickersoniae]|nr:hypothetical protein HK104_005994 [Borealophlyctis nickersoniae]